MSTAVTTTPAFTPGATTLLFDTSGYTAASELVGAPSIGFGANRRYAVARDGQRFLFLKPAAQGSSDAATQRLMVVENWFEELKQRVPN